MKFYQKVILALFTALAIGLIFVASSGGAEGKKDESPKQATCQTVDERCREECMRNRDQIITNYRQIYKNMKNIERMLERQQVLEKRARDSVGITADPRKPVTDINAAKKFTAVPGLLWPVPMPDPLPEPRAPEPKPAYKIVLC